MRLRSGRQWPAARALERLVVGPLAGIGWTLAHLPSDWGLWVGRRLGDLAYCVLPGRRAAARENLLRAFGGEQPRRELRRICKESFRHLGMTFVEACTFFFRPPSVMLSRVEVEGVDHLRAAVAQGRGVLLLTAHFGNWELLAAANVQTGYPLSVVARPLDSPVLDRLVVRFREGGGVEVIPKRRAVRRVLEALRRGSMVGILLDQNTSRREGVFVPFFGDLASTSKSLAVLAFASGAPVVPVFIHREPHGRHRVVVEPAIPPPSTGDRERDILAFTAAFASIVEARIRQWPGQWLWIHRRWKTRPAAL
jgi:KDO2-lipid IV(A) lauroyltransferase